MSKDENPSPSTQAVGIELDEWERLRLAQYVAGNALTYMSHYDRGGLKPNEVKEMERWKALSDKLKAPAPGLPQDVVTLVIAAREAFDTGMLPDEERDELDRALEPFSERVPYENQPEADL